MIFLIKLNAQELKFYTSDGKTEVKQASCKTKDLLVKVPIPANSSTYDKIRFFVFVTPNRQAKSSAVYHVTWQKEELAGVKEMTLVLKSEDKVNEFHYGGYGMPNGVSYGNGSALDIDFPCSLDTRTEQFYKLSFELEGLKFSRYGFNETGVKEAVYSLNTLKKWHDYFTYDYGKADQNMYTEDRKFSIKKVYDNETELQVSKSEIAAYMGAGLMNIRYLPVSSMSVEDIKKDIINTIKKGTLNSIKSSEEPKESWQMEFCYPCYAKKIKKGGDQQIDDQVAKECASPADWKPIKINGKDGFVFETNFGLKSGARGWDRESSKPLPFEDERFGWQSFLAFVVEHEGNVYVGVGYNTSEYKSAPYLPKFFKDVMESIKFY